MNISLFKDLLSICFFFLNSKFERDNIKTVFEKKLHSQNLLFFWIRKIMQGCQYTLPNVDDDEMN